MSSAADVTEPPQDDAAPGRKRPRAVRPELCVGCLVCVLRCSLRLAGAFAPSRAALRVIAAPGAAARFEVEILESCDGCGLCARHCPYGALAMEEPEK